MLYSITGFVLYIPKPFYYCFNFIQFDTIYIKWYNKYVSINNVFFSKEEKIMRISRNFVFCSVVVLSFIQFISMFFVLFTNKWYIGVIYTGVALAALYSLFFKKLHIACPVIWSLLTIYFLNLFGIIQVIFYWILNSKSKNDDTQQPAQVAKGVFTQHARIPILRIPIIGFKYKVINMEGFEPTIEMDCIWWFLVDKTPDGKRRWFGMKDRLKKANIQIIEETPAGFFQSILGCCTLLISCKKLGDHQDKWYCVPPKTKKMILELSNYITPKKS